MSNSPGLVDFAIRLVNFVLNLPNGQVKFFEEIKLQKNCKINSAHEMFLGLVEMTFGLVYASFIQLARIASFKNDFLCTLTSHDDGNFRTHVKMCRFRSLEASNFDHLWHQPSQTIWLSFSGGWVVWDAWK